MTDTNYTDRERIAYVKADPTAVLLARIADLQLRCDELEAERDKLSEQVEALRAEVREAYDGR